MSSSDEAQAWAAVVEARQAYEQYGTPEARQLFDETLDAYHMTRGELAWQQVRAESEARKVARG